MSEVTARRSGRGRMSMIEAARSQRGHKNVSMKTEDGTYQDFFKLRVACQRFMNENWPIFEAFARTYDSPEIVLEAGALSEALGKSHGIAQAIAGSVVGKDKPTEAEVAPFRAAAARIVSAAWEEGGLKSIDLDAIVAAHSSAFAMVEEEMAVNIFKEREISDQASVMMTAAAVTERLMGPVMVYDFRRNKAELLADMTNLVLDMASRFTSHLKGTTGKDDVRSVMQTASNSLAGIMAAIYERKVRQVVEHLVGKTETEKAAFSRHYNPVSDISKTFEELGSAFVATALVFGDVATQSVNNIAEPKGPGI